MKKYRSLLYLIFGFIPIWGLTQTAKVDSLKTVLDQTKIDSVKLDILLNLSSSLWQTEPNEGVKYAKEAVTIADQLGQFEKSAIAFKNVGLAYYALGDIPNVLEFWQQSLGIYRKINNDAGISNLLGNIGAVYNDQGDDAKALELFLESLRISENTDDSLRIATTLINIGFVYLKKPQTHQEALRVLERALSISEAIDFQVGIGTACVNIGETFLKQNEVDSALFYLEQARDVFRNSGGSLSYALNNIGKTYVLKGDYQSAIKNQKEAVDIAIKNDLKLESGHAYLGLADTYKASGNLVLAKRNYQKAQLIYQDTGTKEGLKDSYFGLAKTFESLGDFRNAYQYHELYSYYKDTLYNVATDDKLKSLKFTYDIEQKEAEIALLNKENDLQEAKIQKAQLTRNLFIIIAAALLIIGAGIVVQFLILKKSRERKQALEKEKELTEHLQQIDKLKDQFLANTSHELRTPLNGIIGLAESLKDGAAGSLPPKAIHDLEMITSSGKRLSNLVNDILDFSKLKNHDLDLQLKPVDIHSAVNIVLQLSRPLLEHKEIELINKVPKNASLAESDENRLQQMLHNLIGNAIKFTETGTVEVSMLTKGDFHEISVRDTGIGIPKEKFDTIFRSFEQGDGDAAREFGGTGLGLSVTKQLVDVHGGKIWVESEVGAGSTFTFTLPVSKASRSQISETNEAEMENEIIHVLADIEKEINPESELSRQSGTIETYKNGSTAKVLVVDDEPVNRQVLENHLSNAGYAVVQAASGQEALDIMEVEKSFDLILLDIMMPKMSGYEVCDVLRNKFSPSELPVVMLTAKNRVNDLVDGFNAGANDYLTKPFAKDELLSRIKTHLNLHRINKATGKFVPMEFLEVLGRDSITEVRLGDSHEEEVTVFFSDIRSYTTLSETMSPNQNFKFVNAYNKRMGPIINQYNGFINQYLGDGIMAIFPKSPVNSLRASIDMQHKLQEYNQSRAAQSRIPIKVGMGLHTGSLIMGIIGDGDRMDPATISDAVNTAARIEGLTKYFGVQILLSGDTLDKIEDRHEFNLRYLGKVLVKGKKLPVDIFECFDGDLPEVHKNKLSTKEVFDEGVNYYYQKELKKALKAFEWVHQKMTNDQPSVHFINKIKSYLERGLPADWDGVERMLNK